MRKRIVLQLIYSLAVLATAVACDRSSAPPPSRRSVETGATGIVPPADAARRRAMATARADAVAPGVVAGAVLQANGSPRDLDVTLQTQPLPPVDAGGEMLVREGQASIEVKRLSDGVTAVRQTAAQLGGFVANTTLLTGNDARHTATLQIRVPTGKFDQLLAALPVLGKVESVSAQVEDVGGEYVDLQAREANARHMEARLLEMLSRRTGKLSEVLSVEQELRRVREEIERYDARLNWLARRTALSSLDVTIHEPLPLLDREPGRGPLAEAFGQAWERAVAVVAFCIAALGVLIPLGVLAAVGVVVARRLWRPGAPGVSGA